MTNLLKREWEKIKKSYGGVRGIFAIYWAAYGGTGALLRSPYLHFTILLLLPITFHTWASSEWWNDPIAALPNLLGFSLAGFAMFIGFGDERFRELLAEPEDNPSRPTIYVGLCSTFVHFIVVQVMAFIWAYLSQSLSYVSDVVDPIRAWLPLLNAMNGAIGYGLFLYALVSILAATMHVFRISNMYANYKKAAAKKVEGKDT